MYGIVMASSVFLVALPAPRCRTQRDDGEGRWRARGAGNRLRVLRVARLPRFYLSEVIKPNATGGK